MKTVSQFLEDVIKTSGGFGRFQLILVIIILGAKISVTWTTLMMAFAGAIPDWWCYQNDTDLHKVNHTDNYKTCMAENQTKCQRFIFESSMSTVVSQFALVCDKRWIAATATSVQMIGLLISSFIMGQVSDAIGRKPVIFIGLIILCLSNLVCAFSVSWEMFVVMRFFLGFGSGTYLTVYFTLLTEFISNKLRPVFSGLPSWAVFGSLFALMAYILPNWKDLHIATAVSTVPFLMTWWIFPESFRWLVSNKRYSDAENVIKRMAEINKKPVPDFSKIEHLVIPDHTFKRYTLVDILKNKYLMKNTIFQTVMWFSCAYSYYANNFGVQNLSGNLYLNIFLLSVIAIPTDLSTIFSCYFFGRKWTAFGYFLIASASSFVMAAVKSVQIDVDLSGRLINSFSYIANPCISAGWCALYVLCSEVYPTVVRNIGFGVQNTAARVGAMVAPQMVYLAQEYNGISYYLSGGLLLLACLCALLSPETKDKGLEDIIAETRLDVEVEVVKTTEHYPLSPLS